VSKNVALRARRRGRASVFSLSAIRELHDLGFRREELIMSTVNSANTPEHAVASPLDGVRSVPADGGVSNPLGSQRSVPATPAVQNPAATNPLPNSRPLPANPDRAV
jgi:hypothetical protein